jgi:hypothetical protein
VGEKHLTIFDDHTVRSHPDVHGGKITVLCGA